ncbi:MAG: acyltransferase, partial [Frankiales bacterium]|nr:acyltransferase [Frankiales bacterium]
MAGTTRPPLPSLRDPTTSGGTFRPDVEGLRAVAVLLVVASHVLGVPAGGYVGVDVFFVISGFLITGLLLREHGRTGRISLRDFYARRVRRLLPAAVLVLAVTNVAAYLLFTGERAGQVLRDSLWSLGFLANVRFADIGTDYFDQTRPASPVQHYWSLAVEEQFYVLWPCLLMAALWLGSRGLGRRRGTAAVLLLVTVASLAWSVLLTAEDAPTAYFSSPARAWELGVGALLAVLAQTDLPRRIPLAAGTALGWIGLGGILVAAFAYSDRTPFPGSAALLPVLAAAAVLLGGEAGAARPNPVLVNPVATYVGRLSYSLYLWHWPVLVLSVAVLPEALHVVVPLVLSFVLAALCHHLVEEPVHRSSWLSRRPPLSLARGSGR